MASSNLSHEQEEKLKEAFAEKGVEYIFHYYDNLPHGVGIAKGTEAENWITEAVNFWLSR